MVERNASRISFLDVSTSGDVENRSVKLVGVHADDGSNEATDSVALAVDNLPVRIKLKSNVGFEVTLVGMGVQAVDTDVAGDKLLWAKRLRVSIFGGRGGDRVGIEVKLCSRSRSRFSRSLWLAT